MSKQQEIKSLTWKYFWQQKVKEVLITIFGLFLFFIIPTSIGKILKVIGFMKPEDCLGGICGRFETWGTSLAFIVFLVTVICILYSLIESWIESNWEEAEYKAMRKIK